MFKFSEKKGVVLWVGALIAVAAAAAFQSGAAAKPFLAAHRLFDQSDPLDRASESGSPLAPVEAVWSAPTNPQVNVPVELDGTRSTGVGALSCAWTFEDESGATVWQTREGCAIQFTFESTGTKYVRLSVRDANGDSASSRKSFVVTAATDTTPPDTTVSSGPSGTTTSTTASFSFASTEAGSSFECKLDSGAFAACASPKVYSGLGEGAHSFSVRAADTSGNVDQSPATRSWTVETPPPAPVPVEAVWSAPTNPQVNVPVELDGTRSTGNGTLSCTWTFEDESGATVWQTREGCAIQFTFESTGTKYVRLSVRDANGDSASSRKSFVVTAATDTTPPDTTISSGPSGTTTSTTASFSFASTEAGSSFECKLDSGAFAACASPKAYSGLGEGAHSFSVRTTDSAGNVDQSPATRSWTVEASSPPPTPDPVEAAWSAPTNPQVNVPVDLDGTRSTGNGTLSCTWTFEDETGTTVWQTREGCAIQFTFESTGTKYVRLSVRDANGDSASSRKSFVVTAATDTTPPDTTISSGPSGTTTSTTASFSFTSTEAGSSFECKLDSGAFAACASPKAYSGLGEGAHSFSVRATDAMGNVDTTPASDTWSIQNSTTPPPDTTPPDTTISSGPSGTTTSTTASFSFASTEAGSSFECKLDSGAFAACASPKAYSGLGEGAHSFSVRAADTSGNVDQSPATRSWTVDTSSTQPPSGSNCFPAPGSCGYPDPSDSGVPPGTTLTQSGAITASTAGQVIDGKEVSGGINVTANNVTIQNSRISNQGNCGTTNTCGNWAIRIAAGVTGTVIRNVETVAASGATCEHDVRMTSTGTLLIEGAYLHACDSNVYSNDGATTTLKDSYGIAKIAISTDHVENIYFDNSTFNVIHSTLLNPVSQTAVIFGNVNTGAGGTCSNHLTIEESLLAGGGYTLYPCGNGTSAGSSTWVVKNNHFARCRTSEKEVSGGHWVCQSGIDQYGYYPRGGSFGLDAWSFASGRTWSGNVWDDNLASISAP